MTRVLADRFRSGLICLRRPDCHVSGRPVAAQAQHLLSGRGDHAPAERQVDAAHPAGADGGRKRFNELGRALGAVSSRTLCCRLRELEEQGLLVREIKNTIPPWVEYELTEKGRSLSAVIDSITTWGEMYMVDEIA